MKYETYKQLTKEEKEEWNFKFGKNYHEVPFGTNAYLIAFGFLLLVSIQLINMPMLQSQIMHSFGKIFAVMILADFFCLLVSFSLESKWINKRLKVVHK
jgi:hypothetical protein